MEDRAQEWSKSHGMVFWLYDSSYSSDSEWFGRTSDGVLFLALDGLGPSLAMTFRPSYVDQVWKADNAAEFEKLLKQVNITPRRVNSIGREWTGMVTKYSAN